MGMIQGIILVMKVKSIKNMHTYINIKKNKSHRMGKHYLSTIAVKSNRRIVVDMDSRAIELKIPREIW